jgi:hypothetical protein
MKEEIKRKINIAKKGKPSWNKGISPSKETRKKISETLKRKGIKPPLFTQKRTEEWKKQHSKKMKGRKITWGSKISAKLKGRKGRTPWNKGLIGVQAMENSPRWLGGKSFEPYGTDWTKTLRQSIRERDKYLCQLCFEKQNDTAFDVHHIDYNKKNCNPDNLITLCRKCHMKTNSNRSYWKKHYWGTTHKNYHKGV